MKVCLLFLLLLFFPLSQLSAAEPVEPTLPPVVVTATRTEIPQRDATTSISVISAEDIRAQQAETVLEVLRGVPGLDVVQTGSRGNITSVFIRGSESNQVLVLVDGVEVNSTTTGAFDFAHLTTESVERIEILRGSGGTLYGSQAIGGVIQIITKAGKGKPEVTLSAEGGNKYTNRQVFALQGGTEKLSYFFSGSHLATDGFRSVNDDYRNLAASSRVDFRPTDSTLLRGVFHFRKTDLGLFNSNNFIPVPDPNARENVTDYLAKLDWEQKLTPAWDYRLTGSFFKEHDKFTDNPEPASFDTRDRSRFRPEISTAQFQTNYRLEDWSTSTFGVEFKRSKASTSSTSDGFDLGGIDRAIRNMGYYFQEQIKILDGRLMLIPGVRLDDHQTFGTEWSPSFSASYLFRESGTKLKTGYAEGFRAPTLNELFFPAGFGCPAFGNPNLGPEKSWELNAGIEQNLLGDRVKLGATYFHREVEDLIQASPIPGAPSFCSRAENVGHASFDGVELGLAIQILSGLSLGTNYTYLHWDTDDGKLIRRPRHRGSVNLDYVYQRFHFNLDANIVGKRDDRRAVNFSQFITQPGYLKFDLAGSYQLPVEISLVKSLSLFGKIENLFNRKYEEADGFRARPLNFLIGIRGTFGSK